MGFFGFVFWMMVLWCAFRWWTRHERRVAYYGPYNGWYDSGEFYGRRPKKLERKERKQASNQQDYIDSLEARVADLEERLDFTERLLANRQSPSQAAMSS